MSTASSVKAQILAENQAKVERRKAEQRFISNMSAGNGYRLSEMDDVKAAIKAETEARRIEYTSPREVVERPSLPLVDPVKLVGSFAANVRCMETTHGGSTLWTADEDGSIGIRSAVNGQLAFRIEPLGEATVECLYAAETTMWVGLSSGKTRIYDQQVFVLAFEGDAHTEKVTAFAQSFDGKTFSTSEDGTVVKWDVEDKKFEVLSRITDFGCPQRCLHCYGYNLFVGGDDGIVRAFDSETSALLRVFDAHTQRVSALAVLDGFLFTASVDATIAAWNMSTGEKVGTLIDHAHPVTSLMADPVGHHLWSADQGGEMKVWSSKQDSEFALIHTIQHDSPVGVISLKGVVAVDSVKVWTFGSNGENKVWHASKNRIEEAVRDAIMNMKNIIDQDEIELAKWADLIQTLREVAKKLDTSLSSTLATTSDRSIQRGVYFMWLRWLFFSRLSKIRLRLADTLVADTNKDLTRRYYKAFLLFLLAKKRQRSKVALADLLASMSKHRLQYQSSRHLQQAVVGIKHARNVEIMSNALKSNTDNASLRQAFNKLAGLRQQRVKDRQLNEMASSLATSADDAQLLHYYNLLKRNLFTRPLRDSITASVEKIQLAANVSVLRGPWNTWVEAQRRAREEKLKNESCATFRHNQECHVLGIYYNKWMRFVRDAASQRAAAESEARSNRLESLRRKAVRCEGLMARRELIKDAENAIKAAHSGKIERMAEIHRLLSENAELEGNIKSKVFAKRLEREKSDKEKTIDLLALLKSKLINFYSDHSFIDSKIKKAQQKAIAGSTVTFAAGNMFRQAHQEIKKRVVTHVPSTCDQARWELTESMIPAIIGNGAGPVLSSIKEMIAMIDVLDLDDQSQSGTNTEIALNADWLEKIADECIRMRKGRSI